MPRVYLTANLQKYFPKQELQVQGASLLEVLKKMDEIRPGFSTYIIDEQNIVRRHVNVFINKELLQDKTNLSIEVNESTVIHLMQALSGG